MSEIGQIMQVSGCKEVFQYMSLHLLVGIEHAPAVCTHSPEGWLHPASKEEWPAGQGR